MLVLCPSVCLSSDTRMQALYRLFCISNGRALKVCMPTIAICEVTWKQKNTHEPPDRSLVGLSVISGDLMHALVE